jgi:hypothetical protein
MLPENANVFSFAFWINRTNISNYGGILSRDKSSATRQWFFAEQSSGRAVLRLYQTNGTSREIFTNTDVFLASVWTHFCITIDGPNVQVTLYINGTPQDFTPASWDGTCKNSGVGTTTTIRMLLTYSSSFTFLGDAADFVIYNRLLTSGEVRYFADPSEVNIGGLILPPKRVWWPGATAGAAPSFAGTSQIIGGGIIG